MQELEVLECWLAGNRLAVESGTIEQIIETVLYPAPPGASSAFRFSALIGDAVVVVLSPETDSDCAGGETQTVVILRSPNQKIRVGLRVDKVGHVIRATRVDSSDVATDSEGGQWSVLGDSGLDQVLESGTFDHLISTEAWVAG